MRLVEVRYANGEVFSYGTTDDYEAPDPGNSFGWLLIPREDGGQAVLRLEHVEALLVYDEAKAHRTPPVPV